MRRKPNYTQWLERDGELGILKHAIEENHLLILLDN